MEQITANIKKSSTLMMIALLGLLLCGCSKALNTTDFYYEMRLHSNPHPLAMGYGRPFYGVPIYRVQYNSIPLPAPRGDWRLVSWKEDFDTAFIRNDSLCVYLKPDRPIGIVELKKNRKSLKIPFFYRPDHAPCVKTYFVHKNQKVYNRYGKCYANEICLSAYQLGDSLVITTEKPGYTDPREEKWQLNRFVIIHSRGSNNTLLRDTISSNSYPLSNIMENAKLGDKIAILFDSQSFYKEPLFQKGKPNLGAKYVHFWTMRPPDLKLFVVQ
ncbi:MAG: hypothetical protein EAZ57_04315 [Cytophagales bacterium]|nr:MAG: hypothetical protein EAZ67_05335 [Cytophagales bacterium]TAF61220.1 MAG: hypothetical protein EAZ57_04315 [Cytophagales bacterium]